jgi:hypothetical protein
VHAGGETELERASHGACMCMGGLFMLAYYGAISILSSESRETQWAMKNYQG